jgi:hypothetical protein
MSACLAYGATESVLLNILSTLVLALLTPLFHTLPIALLQVSGSSQAALSSTAAQMTDPFGIRIAFRPGHPLSLLTWGQYLAIVSRMSRTVEQQLPRHNLEALAAFNSDRRQLVSPLLQYLFLQQYNTSAPSRLHDLLTADAPCCCRCRAFLSQESSATTHVAPWLT